MAPTHALWYRIVARRQHREAERAISVLRETGIAVDPVGDTLPDGPGVFFIDERSAQLDEELIRLSRGGYVRVLVMALDRSVLTDGDVWGLLTAGAADVVEWSGQGRGAADVAARLDRWAAVDALVDLSLVRDNLLGQSLLWRSLLRQVVHVAHFTDAPVLILGETGTGKELIARLIHSLDPRPGKRDLIVLDCTTVQPELAGSEFFGHERGAFTGAVSSRDGAFALANRGTLFLDEIGDLPLRLQAQLLRAIQEGMYKRVGGNSWQHSTFRLVCATHQPIERAVERGEFRADLYYRVGGVVCRVPPLRERPGDILLLFRHFLAEFADLDQPPELDPAVEQVLLGLQYRGNVRELRQLARRTTCGHVGAGRVTVGDLPEEVRPRAPGGRLLEETIEIAVRRALALGIGLKDIGRHATDVAIRVAVSEANGNLQEAARRLGVTDRALQLRRAGGWASAATRKRQRKKGGDQPETAH